MAKRVGIIGYPIRHSISPVFQQAALDHHGLDATYQAWEVLPEQLGEFVAGLRDPDTLGINVTVPHKEAVIGHLDGADDWATDAGAVNTVRNDAGRLVGHNTDGLGFLRALEEEGGFSAEGRRVVIIGAGGSAKGVGLALARSGAVSITIANRTLPRAEELAGVLSRRGHAPGSGAALKVEAVSLQGVAAASASSDLIVNCTTLGMKHGPDEAGTALQAREIPSTALVYDLVYNPPDTPLLREARKAGASTLGGLAMLVYQGAAAFEYWTGWEAPVDVMMNAAKGALV